ncbi:Hok/Gef family protein [Kluyvera intermedia]|uniref:Hok/Gef family protein n=1 Tax=Kluyvera intermedia TaxID=61648 RepID=UPI003525F21E
MFGFCIAAIMTMLVMRKDLKEVCIRADQTEVVVFTAYEAEQESTVGRDPHKIQ